MSTSSPSSPLEIALAKIQSKFRSRIIKSYLELKRRNTEASYDSSFDAAGLSAGKFCEAILRFTQNELTGTYLPYGTHIPNFADECQNLIKLPKTAGVESLRVIIPRALIFIYTLRGKRGIGHVGGDVEANEIDSATLVRVCDWILCELIRIYHQLSLEEAQDIVDAISTRNIPDIWEVAGKKRVLKTGLSYKDTTLLLAYSELGKGVFSEDLFTWTDHSNFAVFKRDILNQLHKSRLIEYDTEDEVIYISPLGIREVEKRILSTS
jgi:hypothetical protein